MHQVIIDIIVGVWLEYKIIFDYKIFRKVIIMKNLDWKKNK